MLPKTESLPLVPVLGEDETPPPPAPTVTVYEVLKVTPALLSLELPPPEVEPNEVLKPPAPPPPPEREVSLPPEPPPATTKKSASKSALGAAAPSANLFQSELSLYSNLVSVVFKRRSPVEPAGL
jgi:hypothetical protein